MLLTELLFMGAIAGWTTRTPTPLMVTPLAESCATASVDTFRSGRATTAPATERLL